MVISENYTPIFKECFLLVFCREAIVPLRGSNRGFERRAKKPERTLMQIFIPTKDFKASVREM